MNRVVVDTDAFSRISFSATGPSLAFEGKIPMLSFATVAEVYFGAAKSNWGTRRIKELDEVVRRYVIAPFDSELPKLWGSLKARAQAAGHPLGQPSQSNDLWICATAIHHDAPLLTLNHRHFTDFPELALVSTEEPSAPGTDSTSG